MRCLRIGFACVIFLALMLGSWLSQAAPLSQEPQRVFYQVYVRALYDGSIVPDGEGDFDGLVAKLADLSELGVDTLLLMPIFASTGDMGYIPRDYFSLDAAYGNEANFRRFVRAAHAHGFKIVLDAPVNHISFDSFWFRRGSQKNCDPQDVAYNPNDPDNRYCDFFYFERDPCNTWPYRNWHKPWLYDTTDCHAVWFQRPQYDPAYHRSEQVYATFFSVMPDLKFWDFEHNNWNEPVVTAIEDFFAYWASAGVDGFRIDAAKHFVEGGDRNNNPQEPRNMALLERFLNRARQINPEVSFLGEIWSSYNEFEPYLPRALDMILDFPFMEAVRSSVGYNYGEDFKRVLNHLEATQNLIDGAIKPGARVVFAGNHDVSRLMTVWNDDEQKWRLAEFLPLVTPHTPLIYYGEEIGMHGKVKRPDNTSQEEYVRTINAFSWTGDDTVGFPGKRPPVTGLSDNYRERNLEQARADTGSTYHMMRRLLRLRREFRVTPATQLNVRGDLYGHVIGWTMIQADSQQAIRCRSVMVNFSPSATYEIVAKHANAACNQDYREVFSEGAERLEVKGVVSYRLGPYAKVMLD